MRVVVLIVALLGAMAAFGVGAFWLFDLVFTSPEQRRNLELLLTLGGPEAWTTYENELRQRTRAYPFLLASGVLGFVGGTLALLRRKWIAVATLFVAGI